MEFAQGTIQLPFKSKEEAEEAAQTLTSRGFQTRVVAWREGWWVTSIDGPMDRLESQRQALLDAYNKAKPQGS
jgi:hypothetical protein